jgi:hypothetical protein
MIVRHDFGGVGIAYVRRYLECNREFGKLLGVSLLERFDLGRGSAWAFVPEAAETELGPRLTEFEHGWVDPKADPSWRPTFDEWLRSVQRPTVPMVVVYEDALAKPSDAFLQSTDRKHVSYDESVFFWDNAAAGGPAVERLLGGATWNPDVAILAPTAQPELSQRAFGIEAITELAEHAAAVAVGAWDDQGFIVWQP